MEGVLGELTLIDSIKSMWSPKLYGMAPGGSLTGVHNNVSLVQAVKP